MRQLFAPLKHFSACLRLMIVFTVIFGIGYPLAITAIAQIPGLKDRANGSLIKVDGKVVGSTLLGQEFLDSKGNPITKYFQPRPSDAGAGYDPTASGASNLGPESIIDTLADPSTKSSEAKPALLSQVCARSVAVGQFDGVDGSRPFCTSDGVGAVLAVFWSDLGYKGHITKVVSVNQVAPATPFLATYKGLSVVDNTFATDISTAQIVPVRGSAPANPAVPADAVTASGSGLDPEISPAYAKIQEAVVAKARGISVAQVAALVSKYTAGRDLGFIGEPKVNVLKLNAALDARYPAK
jgi:K+-transporting ATPase ATPase C chain